MRQQPFPLYSVYSYLSLSLSVCLDSQPGFIDWISHPPDEYLDDIQWWIICRCRTPPFIATILQIFLFTTSLFTAQHILYSVEILMASFEWSTTLQNFVVWQIWTSFLILLMFLDVVKSLGRTHAAPLSFHRGIITIIAVKIGNSY